MTDGGYVVAGGTHLMWPMRTCRGDDHTVRLWDVAAGKELQTFIGHEGTISAIAFSADGKFLASGSDDTSVLIWEIPTK